MLENMKRHTLQQIIKAAADIYKIPTVNSCTLELVGNDKLAIETEFSQLDLDRNQSTPFISN